MVEQHQNINVIPKFLKLKSIKFTAGKNKKLPEWNGFKNVIWDKFLFFAGEKIKISKFLYGSKKTVMSFSWMGLIESFIEKTKQLFLLSTNVC